MKGGIPPGILDIPLGTIVGSNIPGVGIVMSLVKDAGGNMIGATINAWGRDAGQRMATQIITYGVGAVSASPVAGPGAPIVAGIAVGVAAIGLGLYSFFGTLPDAIPPIQTEQQEQTESQTTRGQTSRGETGETTPGETIPDETTSGVAPPVETTQAETTPVQSPAETIMEQSQADVQEGMKQADVAQKAATDFATTNRAEAKAQGLQNRADVKEGMQQRDAAQKAATDFATTSRAEAKAQGLQNRADMQEGMKQRDAAQKAATDFATTSRAEAKAQGLQNRANVQEGMRQRGVAERENKAADKFNRDNQKAEFRAMQAKRAGVEAAMAAFQTRVAEGTTTLNNSIGAPPGAIPLLLAPAPIPYPELSSVLLLTTFAVKVFRKTMGYDNDNDNAYYNPIEQPILPGIQESVGGPDLLGKFSNLTFDKNINDGTYYNYDTPFNILADNKETTGEVAEAGTGEVNIPIDKTRLSKLQVYVKDKTILELIAKAKTKDEILAIEELIKSIYKSDLSTESSSSSSATLSKSQIKQDPIWGRSQQSRYNPLNQPVNEFKYDPTIGNGTGRGNKRSGQQQGSRQGSGQVSGVGQGSVQAQKRGGGRKEQLLISILADIQNNSKSNEEKLTRLLETTCTPYIIKGRIYLLIDTDLLEKLPNLIKILSILETTLYIDKIKDILLRLTMDKELYKKLVDFQTECNKYLFQLPLKGGKPIKKHNITKRNKKQKIYKKTKKQQKNKIYMITKKRCNNKNLRKSKKL
jgi:hypothetical protein